MAQPPQDVSRRNVLRVAAAGAAAFAWAPRAVAEAPRATAADPAAPSSLAQLEARALTLHPPVFLLETAVPPHFRTSDGSPMHIDAQVHHTGEHSLRWDYAPKSCLEVRTPLEYEPPSGGNAGDIGPSGATLALWVYQSAPSKRSLRIELGRGSGTDLSGEMHLDFIGWRTAWIRYEDLEGTPRRGMNTLRLIAPDSAGTLHLDQLILNTHLRSDWPAPDRQVPFVNPDVEEGDNEHWLDLLRFAQLAAEPLPTPAPSPSELADLDAVRSAYNDTVRKKVSVTDVLVANLAGAVDDLGVPPLGVTGGGRAVIGYQEAVYPPAIADDLKRLAPGAPLRTYCDLMFSIASAYDSTTMVGQRTDLADLYLRMLHHLWDQGWDEGSVQGTIHHLGYQARGLYTSVWLMRSLLQQERLLGRATAMMGWMVGAGRTRQGTDDVKLFYNGIFDIINTNLIGMIGTALLADGAEVKVAQLRQLKLWLDRAVAPTPGIEDGFKPDLSGFHHVGHYPDYFRDAYKGGSPAIAILAGTAFALSSRAHELWNQALLRMRFYANQNQWPLGLTGRHPTGLTGLSITPYQDMTVAGRPDGHHELDPEVGAAFLRLLPAKPSSAQKSLAARLAQAGVVAEPSPTGCVAMNHAASVLHRRADWLVAVHGHNRYLWSTEIYTGSNIYGRYVSYGQIQVMSGGDPVTNEASGFVQPGWDWNRWPGTTTLHLPFEELAADLGTTGTEMLLTDEPLGGGGSLEGRNGVFLMSLHENPKYDGSFHARKSVFLFDDRVIALGSGIVNDDGDHATETTLFQCHLSEAAEAQQDSQLGTLTALPYSSTRNLSSAVWLVDPQRVGYYVPDGQRLVLSRSLSTAPDQSGAKQGTEPYATAWLDHGRQPRDARYEYAMVVGASATRMASLADDMTDPQRAPYAVMRHDDLAHVVWDRDTGITGHAVFAPCSDLTGGVLRSVDAPSVVMVRPDGESLVVSVTDPDLHLYEGRDPDQYDSLGRFTGAASPFSRPWRDSPSRPSKLTVRLDGQWSSGAKNVVVKATATTTDLTVECRDGLPTEVRLTRA